MKIAYFDAFAGAAGDMIVAALLDAGCDFAALEQALATLRLHRYRLETRREKRRGIMASRFIVHLEDGHDHHHRTWADIRKIIDAARLPGRAAERAKAIFQRLAEAEAAVHGSQPDAVHFHEVGAVDSIIDIVGAAVALELMGIDRVACSGLPLGGGTVETAHGTLPVPAPATARLLAGVPVRPSLEQQEVTTPTGAAILTTLAESYGPAPTMTLQAVGNGAGSRVGEHVANILRVFVGEAETDAGLQADGVWVIETNLDDATAEVVADASERLMAAGAVDVFSMPIVMKKGRAAVLVTCLAHESERAAVEAALLAHTGTFGLRRHWCTRSMLHREFRKVTTPHGEVRMKIGRRGDEVVLATPEYEDCRRVAEAVGVPVREVMRLAAAEFGKEGS